METNKIALVAHRGGSRENLENTMEAFRHAASIGSNVLEMDICLTKDKKIIVVHDNDLSR
jgi:lysophospholipase D